MKSLASLNLQVKRPERHKIYSKSSRKYKKAPADNNPSKILSKMTTKEFLSLQKPPEFLAPALVALWLVRHNQWDAAHLLVQAATGGDEAWVHAHLHRREGDTTNAAYWYSRSGRRPSTAPPDQEWEQIATELLSRTSPTTT